MPELQERMFGWRRRRLTRSPGPSNDRSRGSDERHGVAGMGAVVAAVLLVVAAVAAYKLVEGGAAGVPADRPTTSIQPGAASSMVDLSSGQSTLLPTSIETSGAYLAVSPDRVEHEAGLQRVLQQTGSPLRSERRRDSGTPDLRERMGCLRGAMVCGRLDARISTTAQLDPTAWEPVRPGRRPRAIGRDSRISIRRTAGIGGPPSRVSRRTVTRSSFSYREATPITRSGTSGLCRSPAVRRRSSAATQGGVATPRTASRSHTFLRSTRTISPAEVFGSRACTGERPEPWLPTGISDG